MSLINITADGLADGRYTVADAGFYEFTLALLPEIRTIAFGRNTFELFQDRWPPILETASAPQAQLKMARALNDIDMHKTVFSSTLKTTTWNNATIEVNVDAAYMNSYKQEGKGGLLTLGSPTPA